MWKETGKGRGEVKREEMGQQASWLSRRPKVALSHSFSMTHNTTTSDSQQQSVVCTGLMKNQKPGPGSKLFPGSQSLHKYNTGMEMGPHQLYLILLTSSTAIPQTQSYPEGAPEEDTAILGEGCCVTVSC